DALLAGRVAPETWRRCAAALLRSARPPDASALLDEIGRAHRRTLRRGDLETSPLLQERLGVMQRLYLERRSEVPASPDVDAALFADLRRAVAAHRLGPVATRFAEQLLAAADAEAGSFRGEPVDARTLDRLLDRSDEPALRMLGERLPDAPLRDE